MLLGAGYELVLPPEGFRMPEETGASYAENARLKAGELCRATGEAAIGDDSGLEVEVLGGRPGLRSSRYAPTDEQRIARLLRELVEAGPEDRAAAFRCVLALALPDGRIYSAEGVCRGTIAPEPRGKSGFGYDPVFLPEGASRTFAEMSPGEKNAISHRALAARAFACLVRDL